MTKPTLPPIPDGALRQVVYLTRHMPTLLAIRMARWARDQHQPVNVGTPDEPHAVCWSCRKHPAWPCPAFVEADERLDALPSMPA